MKQICRSSLKPGLPALGVGGMLLAMRGSCF
jgi:hypothetical protein